MSPTSTTIERPWTELAPVLTLPALPPLSLAPQVEAWCSANLRQPDGPDAGGPWRFTREQRRFLWCWYAIDETGRWVWSRGVKRRAKGAGKSPEAAAICLAELCGPVRFGGFDDRGAPIAIPAPAGSTWVQIAGVSEKQTDNTMTMCRAMLDGSPAVAEYGLDVGLTRIYTMAGGKLEPITASAATAEGARPTFVCMDEPHHWLESNRGHYLAEVIRRNLAKVRDGTARALETTNAHEMGADSVAERTYEAWLAQSEGRTRGAVTILYDSREAPELDLTDPDQVMAGLAAAYGDATWVDFDRLRDEVYDPSTPESVSRRFYFNQIAATDDAWLTEDEGDARADPEVVVAPADEIVAFFDGSKSGDATALVGCRISDGHVFLIGAWEKPPGPAGEGWQVPVNVVDAEVEAMFDRFAVRAFFGDVREWESFVHTSWPARHGEDLVLWAQPGGRAPGPIAWDMRAHVMDFTLAAEAFTSDLFEDAFTHDGSLLMRRHVVTARRRPNRWGVSIGKESRHSAKKIDAAVCVVGARMVRRLLLASPEWAARNASKTKAPGRVVGWG